MASAHDYFGVTVTLTPATTQRLLTLLQAVDSLVPPTVRELTIQNDPASPAALLVGDAKLSTTRLGFNLAANGSKLYRSVTGQEVPLAAIYVRSTGAAVVNVEGWC